MLIRVKHKTDPAASLSFGKGPDKDGAFLVEHKLIETAKSHGFVVAHLHEEQPQVEVVQEKPEVVEEPPEDASLSDLIRNEGVIDDPKPGIKKRLGKK